MQKTRISKSSVSPFSGLQSIAAGLAWVCFICIGVMLVGGIKKPAAAGRAAEDANWVLMETQLSELIKSYDGTVGVYIKDLKTGRVYERNSDQNFISASLIKVPVMAAVLQAVEDGKITLGTMIALKRVHIRGGSGRLKWSNIGKKFPVSELLYKMITQSDNTATAMLIDHLKYDYINQCFEKFGLTTTRIEPSGMSLADYLEPSKDNYTTPHEMGMLFEKIYRHQLVSDKLSDLMLAILKEAEGHQRLKQNLPGEWSLAHKTGLLRRNCHDSGIVFSSKSDYVICVLTQSSWNYGKAKGIIASIGRTIYSYIGQS